MSFGKTLYFQSAILQPEVILGTIKGNKPNSNSVLLHVHSITNFSEFRVNLRGKTNYIYIVTFTACNSLASIYRVLCKRNFVELSGDF